MFQLIVPAVAQTWWVGALGGVVWAGKHISAVCQPTDPPASAACRYYIVVRPKGARPFPAFKMSVSLSPPDGSMARPVPVPSFPYTSMPSNAFVTDTPALATTCLPTGVDAAAPIRAFWYALLQVVAGGLSCWQLSCFLLCLPHVAPFIPFRCPDPILRFRWRSGVSMVGTATISACGSNVWASVVSTVTYPAVSWSCTNLG